MVVRPVVPSPSHKKRRCLVVVLPWHCGDTFQGTLLARRGQKGQCVPQKRGPYATMSCRPAAGVRNSPISLQLQNAGRQGMTRNGWACCVVLHPPPPFSPACRLAVLLVVLRPMQFLSADVVTGTVGPPCLPLKPADVPLSAGGPRTAAHPQDTVWGGVRSGCVPVLGPAGDLWQH